MKVPTSARDPRTGRFKKLWHLSQKGYPRFHAGPHRHKYVHIVKWVEEYGHELTEDQDLHHRGSKLDWSEGNLRVMGHEEHGWYTRLQAYFMKHIKGPKEEREWEEYFGSGASEVLAMVETQEYGEDVCFP